MSADGVLPLPLGPDELYLANLPRDDIGNAERLLAREGAKLRRTIGMGVYWWDGVRWIPDRDEMMAQLVAQRTARAILGEAKALAAAAKKIDDSEEKKEESARAAAHRKWATQSANSARLGSMLKQAWPHVLADFKAWNARPLLFNCTNGTLDLSGYEPVLRAHRREDMITHVAGVAYDAEAACPVFKSFIERVLPDPDVRAFVQRAFGACLTDSADDQAIIIFHGAGANGKSTLMNAACDALGSYAQTAKIETLLFSESKGSDADPDLIKLAARPRLVRTSEPEVGSRLSDATVKKISGGEEITARPMFEPITVDFIANFKCFISCNTRPAVRGGDDGIWRRILLVPFTVQIPKDEQERDGPALVEALKREAPGILNWLIEGFLMRREIGGLGAPPQVLDASADYRADSDLVGRFIGEMCERGEDYEIPAADFVQAFEAWCHREGVHKPPSTQAIGRKLTDMGFGKRKSGDLYRIGLRFNLDGANFLVEAKEKAAQRRDRKAAAAGDDAE